jgi:hypothetical protein
MLPRSLNVCGYGYFASWTHLILALIETLCKDFYMLVNNRRLEVRLETFKLITVIAPSLVEG